MPDPLPPPPQRSQTPRARLLAALSTQPATGRELSQATGLSERDVYSHLEHLQKSLQRQGRKLCLTPAQCLDCGFLFSKRRRLTRPGKCPVCRSTHLTDPRYSLAD